MTITPEQISSASFPRAGVGRRGYAPEAVTAFLNEVASEVTKLLDENDRLGRFADVDRVTLAAENARLAARVPELEHQLATMTAQAQVNAAAAANQAPPANVQALQNELYAAREELDQLRAEAQRDRSGISARAVDMLSDAQRSADTTIAEAERYARDLVVDARAQYQEVLARAQESVARIHAELPERQGQPGDDGSSPEELRHVQAYVHVAQAQLRSILDVLSGEVDKLGSLSEQVTTKTALPATVAPTSAGTPSANRHDQRPQTGAQRALPPTAQPRPQAGAQRVLPPPAQRRPAAGQPVERTDRATEAPSSPQHASAAPQHGAQPPLPQRNPRAAASRPVGPADSRESQWHSGEGTHVREGQPQQVGGQQLPKLPQRPTTAEETPKLAISNERVGF